MRDFEHCDRLIIGAGLYGLYSALYCGRRGLKVQVLEMDDAPFCRATYINQARVHMGYHYPRSLTTALKSAGYFNRFNEDFSFCIHSEFDQIYATSGQFSWTNAMQFREFCDAAEIRCDEVSVDRYFKPGMCDGAYLTTEYTYDAHILRDYLIDEIGKLPNVSIAYGVSPSEIINDGEAYMVKVSSAKDSSGEEVFRIKTDFILNATYASVNQILSLIYPDEMFKIKYELCEIILCDPNEKLKDVGLTIMDGPFFSIMPFGLTGQHSLTSVTFTPHVTSADKVPQFKCQSKANGCNSRILGNCNSCINKPQSAWPYMSRLANKYLKEEYGYTYSKSLFSMKPILKSSEVDDSRPTAIRVHSGGKNSDGPTFISVLSGKINTVYDLDEYLI